MSYIVINCNEKEIDQIIKVAMDSCNKTLIVNSLHVLAACIVQDLKVQRDFTVGKTQFILSWITSITEKFKNTFNTLQPLCLFWKEIIPVITHSRDFIVSFLSSLNVTLFNLLELVQDSDKKFDIIFSTITFAISNVHFPVSKLQYTSLVKKFVTLISPQAHQVGLEYFESILKITRFKNWFSELSEQEGTIDSLIPWIENYVR